MSATLTRQQNRKPIIDRAVLSDVSIAQINSLGGPALPTGAPVSDLKVIMENIAATQASLPNLRIAAAMASRIR